jgi:hypothetical protein
VIAALAGDRILCRGVLGSGAYVKQTETEVEAMVMAEGVVAAELDAGDAAGWVERNLGFTPDVKQARVLSTEIHRGILNCTRQLGGSRLFRRLRRCIRR